MILEQITLQVEPDRAGEFEQAFADGRHLLADAAGCRSVDLLRSVDEPGRYLLRVGWDTVADHVERYVGTPPHTELSALLGAYLTSATGADHLDAQPVQPL